MSTGVQEGRSTPRGRVLAQQLALPVRRFIATESGSAGLLLLATITALVWANSPWSDSYEALWGTELSVRLGDHELTEDLRHWVNDGLMVLLPRGRPGDPARAGDGRADRPPPPHAADDRGPRGHRRARGDHLALNPSGEAAPGWGVAFSTDTAFVLGALALVGPACPTRLRVFLLTLAIADDVGALAIIAVFYTDEVHLAPLVVAGACVVVILALGRLRVWRGPAYFVVSAVLWVAMLESGVHPAIAGVLIAACIAVYPPRVEEVERAARLARAFRQSPVPGLARSAKLTIERSVSPNERLQELLHPWTSYVVVPLFALANAGVPLGRDALGDALASPVTLGVIAGLVVGKLLGVGALTLAAVRAGVGTLPRGIGRGELLAGAALTGIGFTVSLFIVDLAFTSPELRDQAKIGVLAASAIAALLGWGLFRAQAARARARGVVAGPALLDPPVDPGRDHVRGPIDAPPTLVEYADFQCPFCGRATGVVEDLLEAFSGRLRYVVRHLPLTDIHPEAELAAEAAEAAGAQGRFWEMHDRLFHHQDRLGPDDLVAHAEAIELDVERFVRELDEGVHSRRVRDDVASAEASGVSGTPTFFVGGRRHSGAYDEGALARALVAAGESEAAATAAADPAA